MTAAAPGLAPTKPIVPDVNVPKDPPVEKGEAFGRSFFAASAKLLGSADGLDKVLKVINGIFLAIMVHSKEACSKVILALNGHFRMLNEVYAGICNMPAALMYFLTAKKDEKGNYVDSAYKVSARALQLVGGACETLMLIRDCGYKGLALIAQAIGQAIPVLKFVLNAGLTRVKNAFVGVSFALTAYDGFNTILDEKATAYKKNLAILEMISDLGKIALITFSHVFFCYPFAATIIIASGAKCVKIVYKKDE